MTPPKPEGRRPPATPFYDPTAAIRANIRTLREERDWSCQRVVNHLATVGYTIGREVMYKVEDGRRETIEVELLFALAHIYQVDIHVLTGSEPLCKRCLGAPAPGFICGLCSRERAR